jgi:hypothetical protein
MIFSIKWKKHLTNPRSFNDFLKIQLRIEANFFNLIKCIYGNPKASIILSDEGLDAFPLASGTRQGDDGQDGCIRPTGTSGTQANPG